jgi:AAA15 family ATPase/GTPase
LGKVNLFVGGNGSGKSNILEAIGLASASFGRGIGDIDLNEKGVRLSSPELMKSAHKNFEIPKTFELDCNFDNNINYKCNLTSKENDPHLRFHSESCYFNGVSQFGRSGNGSRAFGETLKARIDKSRGLWDQIRVAYDFDNQLGNVFEEFSKYSIYSPQTDYLRGVKLGSVLKSPIGLHGEGLPLAVNDLIGQFHDLNKIGKKSERQKNIHHLTQQALDLVFLPQWTNSVKVGKIDKSFISRGVQDTETDMVYFIDRFMREGRNTLTAYDSSEGTLFLLFISILLAHVEAPKYFALDNVDNALNPRLTRKLVEKIISMTKYVSEFDMDVGPRQVFLTSHNPTSLDAFDLFDEDQKIFIVKRNDKGQTIIDPLKPREGFTREKWSELMDGKNLSQLWLDGMISGANGIEEEI